MTDKIEGALRIALQYGRIDGEHHKTWVIDQMVRTLLGCPMETKIAKDCNGKEYAFESLGKNDDYRWFTSQAAPWKAGIAP